MEKILFVEKNALLINHRSSVIVVYINLDPNQDGLGYNLLNPMILLQWFSLSGQF